MGTCVVGGMISSTMLTLIVVPVMYSLMDQWETGLRRLVWRSRDDQRDSSDEDATAPESEPVTIGYDEDDSATETPDESKRVRAGA